MIKEDELPTVIFCRVVFTGDPYVDALGGNGLTTRDEEEIPCEFEFSIATTTQFYDPRERGW